jgi:hypothetical protein
MIDKVKQHERMRFKTINGRGKQDELLFYRSINYSFVSHSVGRPSISKYNSK